MLDLTFHVSSFWEGFASGVVALLVVLCMCAALFRDEK